MHRKQSPPRKNKDKHRRTKTPQISFRGTLGTRTEQQLLLIYPMAPACSPDRVCLKTSRFFGSFPPCFPCPFLGFAWAKIDGFHWFRWGLLPFTRAIHFPNRLPMTTRVSGRRSNQRRPGEARETFRCQELLHRASRIARPDQNGVGSGSKYGDPKNGIPKHGMFCCLVPRKTTLRVPQALAHLGPTGHHYHICRIVFGRASDFRGKATSMQVVYLDIHVSGIRSLQIEDSDRH